MGKDESDIRLAITEVLADQAHSFSKGNTSSGGKYVSFQIELTVTDEAHRDNIFAAFSDHDAIHYVL